MPKEQKKGGARMERLILNNPKSPCDPQCAKRAWNCHVRGNCRDYDDYVDLCAQIRKRRQLEQEVDSAISEAVGRFPGERRV